MVILLLALIYLLFISLGLPDALLGACWPMMHKGFDVPLSYGGILSFVIAVFTILTSLFSDYLIRKFKTRWVCALSVVLIIIGLFGFAFATKFWMLLLFAVPLGLGAGAIDAALNNYVAVHYESRHMSWLHAMWGVGASIGPYIIGLLINLTNNYQDGYFVIAIIQIVILIITLLLTPVWAKAFKDDKTGETQVKVSIKDALSIKGVLVLMIAFFAYISLEQTAMLWGSSYLVLNNNISEEIGAMFASLFVLGITIGRIINGFISYKLKDTTIIRISLLIILVGIILLFIPNANILTYIGLGLIGLGCAPVYPCIMHTIPIRFGVNNSQSIIGLQMAFAYVGICSMPGLFGIIANNISISLFPVYLLLILIMLGLFHEITVKKTGVI